MQQHNLTEKKIGRIARTSCTATDTQNNHETGGMKYYTVSPPKKKGERSKMKFKTTQKAIKQGYKNVISVSYCGLQSLLRCESPIAYTTRAEGWGADVYQFGNTAIVTGYAPFGNIRPAYETNQRYEQRAREITDGIYNWQEKKALLDELIKEYLHEVTQ